jgi:hypothetical protein
MRDNNPRNEKGERHGHWEDYISKRIYYDEHYVNGVKLGYAVWYWRHEIREYYAR